MRFSLFLLFLFFFFFKQKTAYEMRISDWSSDVCSSDLFPVGIALVSGVSHCPFSFFLRLKAGCRSNRVCLSGEERDGEGGGKSMALARAGRPSAADAHLGVGCRAWRTTRGRLFSFGNERAAALGVPRAGAPPGEGRGA